MSSAVVMHDKMYVKVANDLLQCTASMSAALNGGGKPS